ncbi:uncharacterized protein LOC107609496 isoform X7 [Arachis ipaensis]|uniref:uncharacterized protein LOC107609496 isoform X7 n=1 Tax=Arachis ipaensis TaxID=130454 RepID=UPI0007AF6E71|nr:uncharacterized protein LOC107609496 isoform X7 [Arachis ipaensis]XP_029150249.1 uncharacterized protein LOC112764209 isoform X5 [Arachis hypogaea]
MFLSGFITSHQKAAEIDDIVRPKWIKIDAQLYSVIKNTISFTPYHVTCEAVLILAKVYHRRTDAPSTIHSSTTLALHKLFWTHLRCRLLYRIWPNLFRLPIALRKALMVNRISCDSDSDMSLVHKLTSDTLIEVSIEIPFAFRVIPKQAIESAGTQVLEQILRIMLPRFMSQLVKDYHAWASGDTSREPLGTGEI